MYCCLETETCMYCSIVCEIQLCVLLPRDRNLYVLHIALTTRVFSVLIAILSLVTLVAAVG